MMRSVEPTSGKIGDVLVIQGENLGQESVAGLYLTDGKIDIKTPIIEADGHIHQVPNTVRGEAGPSRVDGPHQRQTSAPD